MFDINNVDRPVEMFIFDIYIAILKIEDTSTKFSNVQDLLYSYNHWDSVIRELEIIGEASKNLLKDELFSKKYQVLVDFRNKITHEYFGIDQDIVWLIIYNDLDEIKNMIMELIYNIESGLKKELIESFLEDNRYLEFVVKKLDGLN
jgi:uncharacterized protein with HEPN domain